MDDNSGFSWNGKSLILIEKNAEIQIENENDPTRGTISTDYLINLGKMSSDLNTFDATDLTITNAGHFIEINVDYYRKTRIMVTSGLYLEYNTNLGVLTDDSILTVESPYSLRPDFISGDNTQIISRLRSEIDTVNLALGHNVIFTADDYTYSFDDVFSPYYTSRDYDCDLNNLGKCYIKANH